MKISIDSDALAWLNKKGIKAVTIKDVKKKGGCCSGAVQGVVVERGEPWDKGKRYARYKVDDIDLYVAANIPPKAESIKVVLKRFIINYLGVTGYEPKAF